VWEKIGILTGLRSHIRESGGAGILLRASRREGIVVIPTGEPFRVRVGRGEQDRFRNVEFGRLRGGDYLLQWIVREGMANRRAPASGDGVTATRRTPSEPKHRSGRRTAMRPTIPPFSVIRRPYDKAAATPVSPAYPEARTDVRRKSGPSRRAATPSGKTVRLPPSRRGQRPLTLRITDARTQSRRARATRQSRGLSAPRRTGPQVHFRGRSHTLPRRPGAEAGHPPRWRRTGNRLRPHKPR
jgi:hypothetical protein